MVVEGGHYAGLVQTFGIALVIFDGIGIGLEHVSAVVYLAGSGCHTLQKVVVIAVYTSHHVVAQPGTQLIHKHRFLSLAKRVLGREHDLEIEGLVLEIGEDRTPERHIVVALYIGHNPALCLFRFQPIGCTYI